MEETISLQEIFDVIRRRLLLILTFVITAALVAAILSYFVLTKQYEAESEFIVNQSDQDTQAAYDVNSVRMNTEFISTYNDIIKSNVILEEVIEKEDLAYKPSELRDKIDVSNQEGSQVVTVTVTDPDPALAVEIVNATVSTFEHRVPEIMNVDNVHILMKAEYVENPTPVAPKPKLNIAIAIVLGGMIGVGIAFLLEYLDTSITTEQEIEKLGLPILGVVSSLDESDMSREGLNARHNRNRRGGFK